MISKLLILLLCVGMAGLNFHQLRRIRDTQKLLGVFSGGLLFARFICFLSLGFLALISAFTVLR